MPAKTPIPIELIHLVIRFLDDSKSTLASCALVCRSWVPISRFIFFRHIDLSTTVEPFLKLLESPYQTVSTARVESLTVTHSRYAPALFNRLLTWRSSDNHRTLSTALPSLKRLTLNKVGWWTLSGEAKDQLLNEFLTITHLKLTMTAFDTYDDFLPLINSFPSLEQLDLDTVRPALHWEPTVPLDSVELPRNLHRISLRQIDDCQIIAFLAPCPNLETLHCRFIDFDAVSPECTSAICKLLRSSGESLLSFGLEVERYQVDGARDDTALDLSKNPNLGYLCLSPYHILPTLKSFVRCREPPGFTSLCLPRFDELDWESLDLLLSRDLAFKHLQEIHLEDRVLGKGELDLEALMPRCGEKGLLRG
ncbi:hypothetical protein E1B28_013619 [Marasmius oreades]|uniref:F-box domain-containing protein n=1 Tax=Marasmius oreades TaxID=181124 RepID=A0A9P7RPY4_9AGAR|nr:uncharacterized protein E1B28_013619 [Marasmius oreades]KAG7087671.1 hypothetical protein E1B28_013619 [Marasmius oreades]